MRFARLQGADLRGATLAGADLLHAQCRDVDFSGADLTNARLDHADLAGAKLSGADLSGASLHHARNLTRAQLEEAKGSDVTSRPPELEGSVPWSASKNSGPRSLRALQPVEAHRAGEQRGARLKPAVWIAGIAVLALLAIGFALTQRGDPIPLSMAISPGSMAITPGGADQVPHEIKAAVQPDTQAAFLPPDRLARGSIAGELPRYEAKELRPDPAPVDAEELPPKAAAVEADKAPLAPAAAEAEALRPDPAAVEAEQLPPKAEAVEPRGAPLAPAAVEPTAEAGPAEAAPATVVATLPDDELYEAAPANGPAAAPDAIVAATPPKGVDFRPAAALVAVSAVASAAALRAAPNPDAALQLQTGALLRVASRVEALPAVFPTRAARAIEIAALPGEAAPATTPAEAPLAVEPPEPLLLAISLLEQKINIYRGLELIETSKVSSGARGYETRTGVFSILEKRRYHHSNFYSNAPMPWMQRLTRSGTALHAGVVPNYPASHGCIRLPFSFAPKLFKITEVGANVVVAGGMPEPRPVEHPNLFHPAAAQAGDAAAEDMPPPLRMLVTRRTERDKLISVLERLAELDYLVPQKFTGKRGGATTAAIKAFQKANGLPATGEITDELVKSVHQAAGKLEPPEGHLFVRQGYKRLFDIPVALSNPAHPLGTHAFTAMQFAPGEAKAPWLAMSVEGGDAGAALDRIAIPADARDKISALLTPGATFIIAETSEHSAILPEGDDFIIAATEVPSHGPKLAAASPAPSSVKKATPRSRHGAKPRRTARQFYYERPPRVRRGFFFRW